VNISITAPLPNTTVPWSFTVNGTYDLGPGKKPVSATDSPGTISVVVYESDGTTPLPNTVVSPNPFTLPPGSTSGGWGVMVNHQGNYTRAVITATLTPTGGTQITTSVSGINISQG
jgi:hypothetical protein